MQHFPSRQICQRHKLSGEEKAEGVAIPSGRTQGDMDPAIGGRRCNVVAGLPAQQNITTGSHAQLGAGGSPPGNSSSTR